MKKIGVNFNPSPTLLLLYSEGGKARRREMPLRLDARTNFVQRQAGIATTNQLQLRDLRKDSDCRAVAARLRLRHSRHLESLPEVKWPP